MNDCANCGHGRHWHRATDNARRKARAARFSTIGHARQPRAGCRWMANRPGDLKLCPCRQFKAEVMA